MAAQSREVHPVHHGEEWRQRAAAADPERRPALMSRGDGADGGPALEPRGAGRWPQLELLAVIGRARDVDAHHALGALVDFRGRDRRSHLVSGGCPLATLPADRF